jgi:hypothetical protein
MRWILGAAAALLLLGATAVPSAADCDRCLHAHGEHGNHFVPDGEKIDLSELGDGETRFFDAGDRQIIATRYGDIVEMTIEDPEDGDRTVECDVSQDRCFVILDEAGDGARIVILKTRSSSAEEDAVMFQVQLDALGGNHFIHDDQALVEIRRVAVGAEHAWVSAEGEDFAFGELHLEAEHGATVRCPEGDTTMQLRPEEDDGPYYCPKHNLELEKADRRVMVKEIRVQKPHND